ncbi:hypothetical protein EI42_01896 [Thermosporothrix hazakensis]|jgi:hypothetical protein|uniref:Uncharacterized protein n=1 Tax=Thermosporothrix hazakensis TaxID=644383 RepID=A0A326UDI9_THEHA|nr:hypothetical protein EI42_01896 [Thermosporothrix hazakensis]GCE50160.1 hypothetical protein KTH_50290 [Thermosporothrix hazakensis]
MLYDVHLSESACWLNVWDTCDIKHYHLLGMFDSQGVVSKRVVKQDEPYLDRHWFSIESIQTSRASA